MHVHILGICGTFMGGIAAIAKEAGHRVTGCDANVYPPMSDQLRALGIDLVEGYGADQLSLRPDVWLIGNVVSRGNPLVEAILDGHRTVIWRKRSRLSGQARSAEPAAGCWDGNARQASSTPRSIHVLGCRFKAMRSRSFIVIGTMV